MSDKEAKNQHERFSGIARKVGADGGETAFEERLKRIAKAKQAPTKDDKAKL